MLATYVSDFGSRARPRTSWFHGLSAGKTGQGPIIGPPEALAVGGFVVVDLVVVGVVAAARGRAVVDGAAAVGCGAVAAVVAGVAVVVVDCGSGGPAVVLTSTDVDAAVGVLLVDF